MSDNVVHLRRIGVPSLDCEAGQKNAEDFLELIDNCKELTFEEALKDTLIEFAMEIDGVMDISKIDDFVLRIQDTVEMFDGD